jgi:hypothetical protein
MYLTKLKIDNVIDAFLEEGNVMVVISTKDSGTSNFNEEMSAHEAVGHPVEILPTTHKLYKSVVEKFNLSI